MDTPQYQQPPLDPSFALLMQQTKQQDTDAMQARLRGDTASLTARFGTLTGADNAGLLARYGANLALAAGGGTPADAPLMRRAV